MDARYWLDRWNSYAISIRCVCWMQWIERYRSEIESDVLETIVGSLVEQLRFLEANLETDICGNHLIRNIRCLMWAGRFFEGGEADGWRMLGESLLKAQLRQQFLSDGVHFELSPAYHCQVFADLVECAVVAEGNVRQELVDTLALPAAALAHLTHPDGCISLMSDGGLHMAYSPAECLAAYQRIGGTFSPPQRLFAGKASGYYVCRGDRTFLVADCGAACDDVLAAHGHADILAFEWDVDGQRIIVDAGVYRYEAGPDRLRFRSVASHNTVQVGERDQVELVGSFRVGRRAYGVCDAFSEEAGRLELKGHHSGFSRAGEHIIHRRTFVSIGASLQIRDVIELNAAVETIDESVVSRLLLHHECETVQVDERNIMIRRGVVIVRLRSNVPMRIRSAEWSPDFGQLIPTKLVELQCGIVPCAAEFRWTLNLESLSGKKTCEKKFACVVGARPNFMKMAPILKALKLFRTLSLYSFIPAALRQEPV